jgi:hypothetical protein
MTCLKLNDKTIDLDYFLYKTGFGGSRSFGESKQETEKYESFLSELSREALITTKKKLEIELI